MSVAEENARVMASATGSPSPGGLHGDITRLVSEIRQLAHDHLELATLETKLSVVTLIRMSIVAIFTALVVVSAWLALLGSAALALVSLGVAPVVAMLGIAVANLLAALLGWLQIKRLSHWLGWASTLRAIRAAPPAATQEPAARAKRSAA